MKKHRKLLMLLVLSVIFVCLFATPAFAITESEVQTQEDSAGREAVTGNLFIWFLCAIAFLKVSQKNRQLYEQSGDQCRSHRRLHDG